jgi:hypothetical protein
MGDHPFQAGRSGGLTRSLQQRKCCNQKKEKNTEDPDWNQK